MRSDYALDNKIKYRIVNFDTVILAAYGILCLLGLYMNLNISSVTESNMITFMKQAIWVCLSLAVMLYAFAVIDVKKLRRYIPLLTIINIVLLILVLIFGREIKGATRSFSFYGVNFQPSLFVRIMLVLYFAQFLDRKSDLISETDPKGFIKHFKPLIILTLITFLIIYKQQHFSTIMISSATLFSILWIARIRVKTMALIILIIFIGGMAIIHLGAGFRIERIETYAKYSLFYRMIDRDVSEIQSDDYQTRQSLISLSEGGFWGTTSDLGQAKNYYLPEPTTDYIYSVIGEEYGFIGALLVFSLYVIIFFRGLWRALYIDDLFLKLACIGLTLNVFFNAFVNIGVAIAALPATGVTLPFISYGGTSLIANSLCIGLVLNITAERRAC